MGAGTSSREIYLGIKHVGKKYFLVHSQLILSKIIIVATRMSDFKAKMHQIRFRRGQLTSLPQVL